MERTATITGTRSIGDAPVDTLAVAFEAFLRPFADPKTHFYVGGASGVDTAALQWVAKNTDSALTVVVPCRIVDQPAGSAAVIEALRSEERLAEVVEMGATLLGHAAYHARNRWMVDHSDFVIGFPRGAEATGGTWYTLNYAADQGKPRLVVPI